MEAFLRDHPELGYQTTAELVRDLLRRWLDEQRTEAAAEEGARASSADAKDAPDAATSATH